MELKNIVKPIKKLLKINACLIIKKKRKSFFFTFLKGDEERTRITFPRYVFTLLKNSVGVRKLYTFA